ncbi:MAG: sensor domain-containing diguanylate cyclase [Acidaminobacteraceae bacterium]
MKYKNSIDHKLRNFLYLLAIITMLVSMTIILVQLKLISDNISKDYAVLYSDQMVEKVNSQMNKEIGLAINSTKNQVIIEWIKDEYNEELKRKAFLEMKNYINSFDDKNIFLVIDKSKNYYNLEGNVSYEEFKAKGVLDEENPEDIWYFTTMNMDQLYDLNVDVDRFINTMRIWINVNIEDENGRIGVIGTGIYINPFLESTYEKYSDKAAETVIINEFGTIQVDKVLENIEENSYVKSHTIEKTIYKFSDDEEFTKSIDEYLLNPKSDIILKLKGSKYNYVAISPIENTNLHAVTFYDSTALFNIYNFLPVILITLIIFTIFAQNINMFIKKVFIDPFQKLNLSIEENGSKANEKIYGIDRNDEFGMLSNNIQNMKNKLDSYSSDLEKEVKLRSNALEKAYKAIKTNEIKLERLFRNIPVGIFSLNSDLDYVEANKYFLEMFGCESFKEFELFYKSSESSIFESENAHKQARDEYSSQGSLDIEVKLKKITGEVFWANLMLYKIYDDFHLFDNIAEGIIVDIQDKKNYELELVNLATTDNLTGLHNRMYFDHLLEYEILRHEREQMPLSMVLLDLDFFKMVNDEWGHDVGDDVLRKTTLTIKNSIRKTDVMARWGGEEFIILLPNTSIEMAEILAENIRIIVENIKHDRVGTVTASFGVAEKKCDESSSTWFKNVDNAMFKAKEQGKNQVVVWRNY